MFWQLRLSVPEQYEIHALSLAWLGQVTCLGIVVQGTLPLTDLRSSFSDVIATDLPNSFKA